VGTHTTSATEINGYFRPMQEEEEELRHVPHSPNSQMVRRRFSVWRVFRHTIDGKVNIPQTRIAQTFLLGGLIAIRPSSSSLFPSPIQVYIFIMGFLSSGGER
jgi:hypothetical protein